MAWIELFYDLVYVATIIQLGTVLSHHPTLEGFLAFSALFAMIWWAWAGFTFYSNRFQVDDLLHRALVFLKMFGIACLAVLAPGVVHGDTRNFALAYVLVRLVLVAFYLRSWLQADRGAALSRRYALWFGVASAVWFASAWMAHPWVWLLWGIGLAIELTAPAAGKLRELTLQYPPDAAHMTERFGLLTIIVLGESFVKVLTDLADATENVGWSTAGMGGVALLITCSVWWVYFDDVVHSRIRPRPAMRFFWLYAHLPLAIGITSLGVGIKKAVGSDPDFPMYTARWLLFGSLALVFASVAVLDWVTERDESRLDDAARTWMRIVSAIVMLALGVASSLLDNWVALTLVALVCVAQVIADLMVVPHTEPEMNVELLRSSFSAEQIAEEAERSQRERERTRHDPLEAIRRGTPSGLRRGLYYFFMDGSWARLFSVAASAYLLLNLVFAALYELEDSNLAGADAGNFSDTFFFSVQTFSTIGYGVISPQSTYANGLVVAQAIVGLLFGALVVGLIFAKASRPQASVLFSEPLVITTFEGVPALLFRVGNARGNEVLEANINVSTLADELTLDGHRLRRVRDLALVRSSQPLFALTWTVIHKIDSESPLHGLVDERSYGRLLAITATMTGYDGTYARTVHARKTWLPEDIRWGERFVDVLHERSDGRLEIDYRAFHRTEPDPSIAGASVEEIEALAAGEGAPPVEDAAAEPTPAR